MARTVRQIKAVSDTDAKRKIEGFEGKMEKEEGRRDRKSRLWSRVG